MNTIVRSGAIAALLIALWSSEGGFVVASWTQVDAAKAPSHHVLPDGSLGRPYIRFTASP